METTLDQQSIETFMSITGSSEPVAIQKLTEHGGNLNQAVNSHFTEGDTNIRHETNVAAPQEDFMDIDEPNAGPFEDFPETLPRNAPGTRGTLSLDDGDFPSLGTSHPELLSEQNDGVLGGISHDAHVTPSAPGIDHLPDFGIEEEMIRAAIEASKREAEIGQSDDALPHQTQSQLEDHEISNAVSASVKSAEQEKTSRELESSETGPSKLAEVEEVETLASSSNGRLDNGSSPINDDTGDADEQPLVRHRSRRRSSRSVREVDLGPTQQEIVNNPVDNESDFPSEWGGISSEEHDEAVMLEAAMFGGVPEGAAYRVQYAQHHYTRNGLDRAAGPYTGAAPRPPSPSLTAQRLIREQQDDEYLASLQADREKELFEQAAREAALEEERRKEEEAQRKLEEEQEIERQLAAKEASLPQEPTSDDENAVTLLVRMPDGSRHGRRFLRTDKLQYLFDFIDVGRVVKPCTYRLVRPFPRRAFSDGESNLTLNELGLTSKQEALFLELI